MIDSTEAPSTRPYLIRAIYEWCTDNGFTPFIAVQVTEGVRVPMEFVKNGEIVLNVSFDATSALKIGNDYIEFKGRFGGVARDIVVPVDQVMAIYARENGQGMAFPVAPNAAVKSERPAEVSLKDAESDLQSDASVIEVPEPTPPKAPSPSGRPALKRIK
jgi:stringent starvation protein B